MFVFLLLRAASRLQCRLQCVARVCRMRGGTVGSRRAFGQTHRRTHIQQQQQQQPTVHACGCGTLSVCACPAAPNSRRRWHHTGSGPSAVIMPRPTPGARAPVRVSVFSFIIYFVWCFFFLHSVVSRLFVLRNNPLKPGLLILRTLTASRPTFLS